MRLMSCWMLASILVLYNFSSGQAQDLPGSLGDLQVSSGQPQDLPWELGSIQERLEVCARNMDIVPVDKWVDLDEFDVHESHSAPSFFSGRNPPTCWDYTWFERYVYSYTTKYPEGFANNIFIGFGGPNVSTSAGDCAHTSIEYGVFLKMGGGDWKLIALGSILGLLEGKECTYSYNAAEIFPSSSHIEKPHIGGGPWVSVRGKVNYPGFLYPIGEIRVGVITWTHNDPKVGHPGDLCDEKSCYWPSKVFFW